MPTECSAKPMGFARVDGRAVVADFDGGAITSNAGGLLLGATDRAIGLVERFAACFTDGRAAERVVHEVATLVGQRVFGIALGYEDLIDHDRLRHDPVLGVVLGRLEARHGRCAPLAGKSTLNRLEHGAAGADRYRRIAHDGAAIEALFVDLFLDAHDRPPKEIVLDLDATDDPAARPPGGTVLPRLLRLPLLPAALRLLRPAPAGGEAAARRHRRLGRRRRGGRSDRRPDPRPLAAGADHPARRRRLRPGGADGLVRGKPRRLPVRPRAQPPAGRAHLTSRSPGPSTTPRRAAGRPAASPTSAGRRARAGAAAGASSPRPSGCRAAAPRGANPRFVVTSLKAARADARTLYEQMYCARGEMENRIKECQLDLFADRTSAATMRANQLRLWFASMAYVLVTALRRIGLAGTELATATCGSIRLKLLKIGALVTRSVRRIRVAMASSCPDAAVFRLAHARLCG